MWVEGKAGVHREIGSDAPAADNGVGNAFSAAAKHAAFAEGQIIRQVTVEEAGDVRDAAPVVTFRVIGVLEEEAEASLAHASWQRFFITERPEVAEAVRHALGPGVVGLESQSLPRALRHGHLQSVVPLNAAGVV